MEKLFGWLSVIAFLFGGCSHNVIILKSDPSPETFVLQLDKADLYFAKSDVLQAVTNKIKEERDQVIKARFESAYEHVLKASIWPVSFPVKLTEDTSGQTIESAHVLVHEVYYQLLKTGKVRIFSKATNTFEPKARYKTRKSGLGQRGEVFYFNDGTEFYYHVISFGE